MSNQPATEAIQSEQSVLCALLLDNDALYRVPDLTAAHFYRADHRDIFAEISRQVIAGKRCDVITLFDVLRTKVDDCLVYLNQIAQSVGSAAGIGRYADIVMDRAIKRSLAALGGEMQEMQGSIEPAGMIVDRMAAKVEALAQKKTKQEPQLMCDMLGNYFNVIQARMEGKIKPIHTGFVDLDRQLDGGLERGTLTVVAARPSMGKTAMGLCIARNVAEWGSSLFLSMEMSRDQVNDRNISAMGGMPISWLRNPGEHDEYWDKLTAATAKSQKMNFYIDDQTSLNMLDIRSKARNVKRMSGLDVMVIDQLSFITGGESDKSWEVVGEYTRGLLALGKELNIAIVLLCQLNRKCEERNNKRPMLSDLAVSGSIEQDAANVMFLYRDEIYNSESKDKGICEVIMAKQRQGQPGAIALAYLGHRTLFEDLAYQWMPQKIQPVQKSKGFD